ncbi:hypothetical protein DV515_00006723 [Chloebia gouldiae]|uniref:Uncharacterized protein n=1 Tax=Chloebia gouldiae TaxID=44316 RepID=A0A3L8SJE7_CHLGU|nr:hypothetical protein DV515_00006723 [Chloebia gouldiae]
MALAAMGQGEEETFLHPSGGFRGVQAHQGPVSSAWGGSKTPVQWRQEERPDLRHAPEPWRGALQQGMPGLGCPWSLQQHPPSTELLGGGFPRLQKPRCLPSPPWPETSAGQEDSAKWNRSISGQRWSGQPAQEQDFCSCHVITTTHSMSWNST